MDNLIYFLNSDTGCSTTSSKKKKKKKKRYHARYHALGGGGGGGGQKRLPKFNFSAKFPIGLHVILQIQIKKFEIDCYIM